jgi:hypothetical protein
MSVVCLRPPEFVSDLPRSSNQLIGHADLHRSLDEPPQHRPCARLGDLPPPGHLVKHRARLCDHELWREELVPAQAGKAHRRMARGDRHRGVNNQVRQWPLRERWSAATQLSAGVPSSPTRHSLGSSDIGCSSSSITRRSRSSIACLAPTRRAGKRPDRIHRRTVSGFLPSRSAASATVSTQEMVRQAPDHRHARRIARLSRTTLGLDRYASWDSPIPSPIQSHDTGLLTLNLFGQPVLDRRDRHRPPE